MKKNYLLLASLCLFIVTNIFSTDKYVGTTVTDGGATLGSEANPYLSLSDAITAAIDNDKIIIVGTITQNSQIAFNKALTFEGASNAMVQSTGANRLFNITADAAKTITFTGITFQNFNSAFQGSVLNNSSQTGMTLTFIRCNFLNNSTSSENGGGVFYIAQNPTINFTGCTFYNNAVITSTAANARGGAIHFTGSANATITNCTFSENKIAKTGNFEGAAIRVNSNSNNITVQNSLFYNNKANNGTGLNSDFNGVGGATMSFLNSLAQYTNNVDTETGSNITADFTNTTFAFVSPNLTYNAPNSLTDATPIDFGNDNNDAGAWDSGINIFEGTASILWSENSNWSSGTAPIGDGTENIAIIGAICNMFTAGVAVNNIKVTTELRIQGQNVFIVNGESDVTGIVRYFANLQDDAENAKAWYLISSPLSGEVFDDAFADKNDITIGSATKRGIATYNPGEIGSAAWTYFSDTNNNITATSGQGFSMKITPDAITFADNGGEYADNDVGFEGDFTTDNAGVTINTPTKGFNLLGNPYVAHINSATFLGSTSGIDQSQIWVWNQTLNGGDGGYEVQMSGDSFMLAPAQGFFVNVTTAESLNFAESNQATTGGTFQKIARTELKLLVSDSQNSRFTKLYFLNDATKGYDFGWEGEVFGGVKNDFELYTHLVNENQGKKYQKQSLPASELESLTIPIGVVANAGKKIIFSLELSNFPLNVKVYLEDRLNNTFNRLDETNTSYEVTLSENSTGVGRFYLHTNTKNVLSTIDVALENISVFTTNRNTLKVVGLPSGTANLKLYDILGKQVMQSAFISTGVKEISLPKFVSGAYIVQLQTEAGKLNKKIILE
ncbi:T9SS type A sorting domain-containing protein [Polaribacter litorisediminis]|uniref:T9SS type A sorting domain-containing protein n=1 Tax=Polaribacter litorisediminis TaxID=1908341 RepID=UPI001CBD9DA4|nr:T9SS type A sorting domain-containing protein [Polaribacter litorisediminis]UAM98315.1 T9SS type A sorting domain-containing protein [Polaribacter litorisediminis]